MGFAGALEGRLSVSSLESGISLNPEEMAGNYDRIAEYDEYPELHLLFGRAEDSGVM